MERRKEEARQAILADRTREAAALEEAPIKPSIPQMEAFPKPNTFFKKKEKDKLPAKPILPPKLHKGGHTVKSPNAKRQQIEDMFKSAPKRFERKPKANGPSMNAILERAKKL